MSNGEKACQLICQLAEPCAALRVGRPRWDCGSEQTVALGCAPVTPDAIWPRSHGAKGENESVAGVYTGAGEAMGVSLGFRPLGHPKFGLKSSTAAKTGIHLFSTGL